MCMQDLSIQAGLTVRRVQGVYDAAGNVPIPGFRRAVMIWGFDTDSQFRLAMFQDAGSSFQLPSATDLGTTVTAARVYRRESFSLVPPGQLVAKGVAGSTVDIFIAEYDAATDSQVLRLSTGGY